MSLLVDPDYAIHSLRLAYLRRIDDHSGPRVITFPHLVNLPDKDARSKGRIPGSYSSDGLAESASGLGTYSSSSPRPKAGAADITNSTVLSPLPSHSPVVIAGLNDARYQPELTSLHSPKLATLFALQQDARTLDLFGGGPSRLGADSSFRTQGTQVRRASEGRNGAGGGLKYTTTILGPGRTGALGMRVGGRRAGSRDGPRRGRGGSRGDSLVEEEGPEDETRDGDRTLPLLEAERSPRSPMSAERPSISPRADKGRRSSSARAIQNTDAPAEHWLEPRNRSNSHPYQPVGEPSHQMGRQMSLGGSVEGSEDASRRQSEVAVTMSPPARPPRSASRSFTSQSVGGQREKEAATATTTTTSDMTPVGPVRRRSASEGANSLLRLGPTGASGAAADEGSGKPDEQVAAPHDEARRPSLTTIGRTDSDSTLFSLASPPPARLRGLSDRWQRGEMGSGLPPSPLTVPGQTLSTYQLGGHPSRNRPIDSSPLSKRTNLVDSVDTSSDTAGKNLTEESSIPFDRYSMLSSPRSKSSPALNSSRRDLTMPGGFNAGEGQPSKYLAAPTTSTLGLHIPSDDRLPSPRDDGQQQQDLQQEQETYAASSVPKRRVKPKPSASQIRAGLEAQQRQEYFKSLKTDPQTVTKRFETRSQRSGISELMSKRSDAPGNPFAALYKGIAGGNVSGGDTITVEVYFPFASVNNPARAEPRCGARALRPKTKSMSLSIRKDATMEEVIGYSLYCYFEEDWAPRLDEGLPESASDTERNVRLSTLSWTLRIVEDGEVDDDYPAIDRSLLVGKFGADELAVCEATPAQIRQHIALLPTLKRRAVTQSNSALGGAKQQVSSPDNDGGAAHQSATPAPIGPSARLAASTAGNVPPGSLVNLGGTSIFASSALSNKGVLSPPPSASIFLRILITPNSEVKYKTTLQVPSDMYLADVLETICRKRQLADFDLWALVVAEKNIVVPLDRTVESLQGNHDLALVKRQDLGDQAGSGALTGQSTNPNTSIFNRLTEPSKGSTYRGGKEIASTYKTYTVNRKQTSFLGRHERTLTLDGDWVHIIPTDTKAFNAQSGTSSFPVTAIISCTQSRLHTSFKLVVARENDEKRYEFEAESSRVAAEIVEEINSLMRRVK